MPFWYLFNTYLVLNCRSGFAARQATSIKEKRPRPFFPTLDLKKQHVRRAAPPITTTALEYR